MSETNQECAYSYTVKRGDSFYLISRRLGVPLRDLLAANPDIHPARLMIGDVLCVPPTGDVCTEAQENQGSTGTTQDNTGGAQDTEEESEGYVCPANRRAIVQEGQTASDLQMRFGLSLHTLQTANADVDLTQIKGGDILCIPAENIPCPLPATVVMGENDTLESLAKSYDLSVAAILRANSCLAPADFKQGTAVKLPE